MLICLLPDSNKKSLPQKLKQTLFRFFSTIVYGKLALNDPAVIGEIGPLTPSFAFPLNVPSIICVVVLYVVIVTLTAASVPGGDASHPTLMSLYVKVANLPDMAVPEY